MTGDPPPRTVRGGRLPSDTGASESPLDLLSVLDMSSSRSAFLAAAHDLYQFACTARLQHGFLTEQLLGLDRDARQVASVLGLTPDTDEATVAVNAPAGTLLLPAPLHTHSADLLAHLATTQVHGLLHLRAIPVRLPNGWAAELITVTGAWPEQLALISHTGLLGPDGSVRTGAFADALLPADQNRDLVTGTQRWLFSLLPAQLVITEQYTGYETTDVDDAGTASESDLA